MTSVSSIKRVSQRFLESGKTTPTPEEKSALSAYQWGHITRDQLEDKIGKMRADMFAPKNSKRAHLTSLFLQKRLRTLLDRELGAMSFIVSKEGVTIPDVDGDYTSQILDLASKLNLIFLGRRRTRADFNMDQPGEPEDAIQLMFGEDPLNPPPLGRVASWALGVMASEGLVRSADSHSLHILKKYPDGSYEVSMPGRSYAVVSPRDAGWDATVHSGSGAELEHLGHFKSKSKIMDALEEFASLTR